MTRKTVSVFVGCVLLLAIALEVAAKPRRQKQKVQTAAIEVNQKGFQPATIKLRRGVPARLAFLRTTDATCAKEVLLPDYGIRADLPLNETVTLTFTPKKRGEFTFSCGMNMLRGKLIVQ